MVEAHQRTTQRVPFWITLCGWGQPAEFPNGNRDSCGCDKVMKVAGQILQVVPNVSIEERPSLIIALGACFLHGKGGEMGRC